MKKYIYIISLAAFYIFSDIICGTQIKKNKNKHAPKSNNYNPYHNLKESDFNNSNFSNEKQYNNKNNFINNEKYIQPYLINNNSLQNKKDINNTKLTLYNEYNKTNNLGDFRNFNHEHEKTNNRLIEINKSFLQITYISQINKDTLNTVDTIYGVNDDESVLSFFYKPLYSSEYILKILDKLNIPQSSDKSKLNNDRNLVLDDVIQTNNSCNDKKQELINQIDNIHNPLYNFYNNPPMDDYKLYTTSKTNFVNCLKSEFEKIKEKPNNIISYEEDVYKKNCKNSSKLKNRPQNNSECFKNVMYFGSNYKRDWEVPKDNETIPFIDFLIKELKQNNNLKTLVTKLEFIKKQIEDIKNKHNKHIEICKKEEDSVKKCINTINNNNNNCDKYFNEIKKIAESYSIMRYNNTIIENLESIRITYKDSLIHFFKSLGNLLINKVDSDGNIIENDDIYNFSLVKPQSTFKSLEDEFHKVFENKWEFYKNNQNLDKSKDIMKNTISLILPLMDKFKGLNDSMLKLKNNGVTNKFNITYQIKNKLNVYTYDERKKGFEDSLELAKTWETKKTEILTKLNEENEQTVQLEKEIRDLFKKYLDEVAEKKYVEDLKLELNKKIKDISEKIEYVKKAVDLNKEIEKNKKYIDELSKKSPYQITKYIEKKNPIYNTIKSYFDQIYVGDIDQLYNEMSSVVQENIIDNIKDKTKLETLKPKIYHVYNKIQNMETETVKSHLKNIETNKNKLSETILEIKKYIYGDISKDLNKTLEDFKNKEQELSNKINDYAKENDQLNAYKSKILEIRNHYNSQINIDNTKEEEAKQNYDKSNEHMKTILTNEDEISKLINEVKSMKNELLSKVNKYIDFDKDYKENVDSEHNKFTELTDKIKVEVSDEKLKKYEKKFNDSKSLINETKKSIEEEYQNINTLKKVDGYIKLCERTKESITNFRSKQTTLKDKLNQNINTIKEIDSIEKSYKDKFKNTLINKINELDKTFKDASLNDHESNNNGLMEYFNNLKANLGKNKENMLYHEFDEKENAINNIIQKIEDINKNISNIEAAIYTSIYNISEEIEDEIGKNIELLNTQVLKKVNENVTNLNEIKGKLKHYNFRDLGEEENIKYTNEINKIKDDIKTVNQQIDNHINKLEDIKKKSESYVGEMKAQINTLEKVKGTAISNDNVEGIENKQKIIVTKIDKKKNIYKEINKLLNEISEIEKDKTSLEELKNINLSYGKSLGKLFLEQIDEEKKKAEHTIKTMEAYIDDLDNIKKKSEEIEKDMKIKMDINKEMEVLKISHDDEKNYHTKSKNHEKSISDIHDKSSKIIQEFSKESDINDIKNKLQENVSESQKHNSDINQYLSKIENIYNILKLNKIQKIIDKVKEYTDEIEKNNKKINDELNNSKTLIKNLEENSSLKECQSKIESTVDDKDIDGCIKNITDIKTYILNEENNINTYFKNAEEYNKIVLLNFNNIEMADTKSQYILNIKTNNGTNSHDYNINELKEHKHKSNGYKDEADKNTQTIKKNKELFEKYKQDVTVLLNKYSALALKNKFDKTKKDSEQIIKEIKETHKNCISQSDKSEQKMNEIKNEQIHIEDEVANNDKSNKAITDIKISVEPFETKFLKIKDIRKKSDGCLKETENIEKQISTLSIDSQETKLKENGDKLNTLEKLFESLKNQKKNIEDQKKELDEVNSKIEKIESDVNQHKKNYEIGIVEKINEIAKANKEQIESTKKLIEPTIKNLISSFNTNDLEGIDTNENLEKYNKEMNNIYEEYIKSYNLITDYLETVSKESITYNQIKNTRITAQSELLKNIENVNKAKSYLDYIKGNEFDRIVTYFKNKLNTVNDKFKNEYLKVNEGFDNISNSINNVKNSTDENSLLDILNQTKEIYANIVSKKYYSYKYEAENIFRNISKLANSLNIQIKNSSGIDLLENINIAILPYLDSQKEDTLTFIPSPQSISETYTKISDSYNILLDILKKSQELHKKEQQTLNLILENRRLYEKVQATNELKDTLSDLKNKKEQILNEVKLLLHKSNELNKLSCNSQNYDTILESSKYYQIKEKSNNYKQEKEKLGIDFDVTAMEEKFNNDIKDIEELENNYNSSEENNNNSLEKNNNILQSKKKLKELTNAFNTEIKKIEDKIIEKNDLINKLIEMRKECLLFTYTTLVETLKIKITDYSEFITSATKFSKEFLKYIDDTSNTLNDDIDALQIKYNLNQTNKYVKSMFADATNDNNNLIEKEKEATKTINNLTDLFTIDSNNIDADTLHNNKIQMLYFNSELHKSIESIKQLYKKMHVFKLLNIGHINEKYFDISKQFDNILQLQENQLTEKLNSLKKIGQSISDKKDQFLHALSETPIPNSNTLKEIYHDIVNYESHIDEIKNISNKENENIILYIDTITKLKEKVQSILNFVTTYENDNNIIKQHIQDNDEDNVSKIKETLKTTIQSFQEILNKIDETKAQFYGNNNINNIISTISKNVNDVKKHLSKDLTIENELIQIQKSLEDIKNSTYEIRSEQITKYINTINNYVEQQTKQIQNNPNKDEIDDIIQKVVNYNKESEIKLPTIIDNKNNVTSIISHINKVINLIKSKYNNNNNVSYNVAKKHEEDANIIIHDLDTSQNMVNNLIQKNSKIINDLKNRKQEMKNRNNLPTINRQQEITQTEHINHTYHHHINDTNNINKNHQYSSSDRKNSSKTKDTGNSVRYAGAITLGLVAYYLIIRTKEKKDKDEMEFDKSTSFYDENENKNESDLFKREDEIIEIDMNEDL